MRRRCPNCDQLESRLLLASIVFESDAEIRGNMGWTVSERDPLGPGGFFLGGGVDQTLIGDLNRLGPSQATLRYADSVTDAAIRVDYTKERAGFRYHSEHMIQTLSTPDIPMGWEFGNHAVGKFLEGSNRYSTFTIVPDAGELVGQEIEFEYHLSTGPSPGLPSIYGITYWASIWNTSPPYPELLKVTVLDTPPYMAYPRDTGGTFKAKIGETLRIELSMGPSAKAGFPSPIYGMLFDFSLGVKSAPAPDLSATALAWVAGGDGVDLTYAVTGADLPAATTVALYWASGPTFASALGGPIASWPAESGVGPHGPIHVSGATLGTPPAGARYLIAVTDPGNAIAETSEGNNVRSLALPDIAVTGLTLNTVGLRHGVDLTYAVTGADLPAATTVALYWASGPTFASALGGPIVSWPAESGVGPHGPVHVDGATLGTPPAGAAYLIAVADPPAGATPVGQVIESDEKNNVQDLEIRADLVPNVLFTAYKNGVVAWIPPLVSGLLGGGGLNPQTLFALQGQALVQNIGLDNAGPFQVVFYSGAHPGTSKGDADYRELGYSEPLTAKAGALVDVFVDDLLNPIFFRDAAGQLVYKNGYYIGVRVDALDTVVETSDANNTIVVNECENSAALFATAMSLVADAWTTLFGLETAGANLMHYLGGSGADVDYNSGSAVSSEIRISTPYLGTAMTVRDLLKGLLTPKPTARIITNLDLPIPSSARPFWGLADSDLGLAIGGVQDTSAGPGASASFSGQTQLVNLGTRVQLIANGEITFVFRDRYEFDDNDIGKSPFDAIGRLLENCGIARPFSTSYTVTQPFRAVIPLPPPPPTASRTTYSIGTAVATRDTAVAAWPPPVYLGEGTLQAIAAEVVEANQKKNTSLKKEIR